jgi:hypothetical protein
MLLFVLSLSLVACAPIPPVQNPTQEETNNPTNNEGSTPVQPTEPGVAKQYSTTVYSNGTFTYHAVGGYVQDWTPTEENTMKAVSIADVALYSTDVADYLTEMNAKYTKGEKAGIKALFLMEDYVLDNQPENASMSPALVKDSEGNTTLVALNQGYAIKCIRAYYDDVDETYINDRWISDPRVAHTETLTPDTLFMPKWVETPAEGEEGLGTWADNPVVIGGAGEYTVIFVEYKGANTADSPKYGMALIKTKELEEPKTTAELIEEEHAALVAGTVTEATLFEDIKATVKAVEATDNADGGKDVKVIAELDGVLFALTFNAADTTGLEAGKEVTFSGKIDASAVVAVGDYNVEIVFNNAEVAWAIETYTKVTVSGVPADATAVHAYWWGSADSVEWPGRAMTKNDDGTYSLDFPDKATGLIFNWTVGDATTQTVDLTPDKEKACWTLGEAGEDGKYPATNAKCYYDAVTVDAAALIADLSDSLVESVTEVPAEYDIYVWFWDGSATGWFEAVNADGTFNVAAGSKGCTFLMAAKGATPAWETKLAQTGDYVIASGVATPKA